jgi:hypothetical protein
MDREPELLQILKDRGPISPKRLAQLTSLSRRCINGALHGSKFTCKTDTRPGSHVSTRPVWTWSATAVRPAHRPKINSRNKILRRESKVKVDE